MKMNEVSKKIGVAPSAIRYYEKLGLIKSLSRVSGRREFDANSVQSLTFVKLAKSVGFSLDEVKQLIDYHSLGGNKSQVGCNSLSIVKQKIIREQIKHLQEMDRKLSELQNCNCHSLESCVAYSIENLK